VKGVKRVVVGAFYDDEVKKIYADRIEEDKN